MGKQNDANLSFKLFNNKKSLNVGNFFKNVSMCCEKKDLALTLNTIST